ncbi:MAG: DUF3472 domain-containing protein [Planctomycetota bacterium]|nr:DUF3472 domain-containing protein [Planctomycetota bacterium]
MPDTLRVPAFTAYIEPAPDALKVSDRTGITGWTDAAKKVVWYGKLSNAGKLDIAVSLRLPDKAVSGLRLTVAAVGRADSSPHTAEAKGSADAQPQTVAFGTVDIPAPGYYSFTLEGVSKEGRTFGDLDALLLSGPAAKDAHFNLKPRRNAASVHLGYPVPKSAAVEWFYNEVTVKTDPLWSYYMACGFHRGYFGIQVNSPTERRIIFSVWDSGNEAVDRKKVAAEDTVQLVAKGEGVFAGGFGNEGTGGHSHLVYNWKAGETYRFLLSAKPDGKETVYSGYFFFPEKKAWGLIASFRAPKDGSYLKGLYSFNENFGGANGDKRRLAEFGNQWIKTSDGQWTELLTAHFTHDATGGKDRTDYAAGVVEGRFYLSNGGFVGEPIKSGDKIVRPAMGKPPADIELPAIVPKPDAADQKK